MLKQFLLVMMTTFMLSCANMPDSAGDLAQNEALQGGLLGGLLCGGAAKLAGLNREQIIIATAGCAGIGAIVGQQLRERRQQYSSDEEFFDGEIKVAQQFNKDQVVYKDRLIAEVNELKTENQRLVESEGISGTSDAELAQHRAAIKLKQEEVKAETRKMQEELKFQEALYTKLKEVNDSSRLASLQQEVSKLKEAIATVEDQQSQLADLDDNFI